MFACVALNLTHFQVDTRISQRISCVVKYINHTEIRVRSIVPCVYVCAYDFPTANTSSILPFAHTHKYPLASSHIL